MSITTPTLARTHVYSLLTPMAVAGTVTVQAAVQLPLPKPVTVALSPAGQDADNFLVRVSVYADASAGAVTSIDNVEKYTVQAEGLLTGLPYSAWQTQMLPTPVDAWVASTVVQVGREDY